MKKFLTFVILLLSPLMFVGCYQNDYVDPYQAQNEFILDACINNNALLKLVDGLSKDEEVSQSYRQAYSNIEDVLYLACNLSSMYAQINEYIQSANKMGVLINIKKEGDTYSIVGSGNNIVLKQSAELMDVAYMSNDIRNKLDIKIIGENSIELTHYEKDELTIKMEYVLVGDKIAVQIIKHGDQKCVVQALYSIQSGNEAIVTDLSTTYIKYLSGEPSSIFDGVTSSFANGTDSIKYHL